MEKWGLFYARTVAALWIEYNLRQRMPHITNERLTRCIVSQSIEPISVQLKAASSTKPKEFARIHIIMRMPSNLDASAVGVSHVKRNRCEKGVPRCGQSEIELSGKEDGNRRRWSTHLLIQSENWSLYRQPSICSKMDRSFAHSSHRVGTPWHPL